MSLSRRNAASESAKKAVARGSWFVKAHHHSEWAVVKYHSGPPFGTAPTSYEQLTTKKHWPSSHLSSRIQGISVWLYTFTPSGHEIRHKRLTRFCASQGSFTYHALRVHHISGGPPFGTAPTSYELRTTNNEQQKSTGIFQCFFTRISGFLSSQGASPQVLSAFAGLTAVFGMGTGGSPQLSPLN